MTKDLLHITKGQLQIVTARVAGSLRKLLPTSRLPIKIAVGHCTAADCVVFIFDLYN